MLIIPTEKRFDWKHAPVALCLIVLTNCFVFFLYQSGDDDKIAQAVAAYGRSHLAQLEGPLFEDYLAGRDETDMLKMYRELGAGENRGQQIYLILSRADFYDYLQSREGELFDDQTRDAWKTSRTEINKTVQSVSFNKFGLIPSKLNPLALLSHQFLHGDVMHLLGNMFFLVICGFAVEAAVGHLRFTAFYLLSGIGGGVLFTAMDPSGLAPLVGASGAISGVMAMYLAAFRLKTIEFFYWFFVFVGYMRAPALLIFPFYVGKELLDFYTNTGSNVAYMAHVGGLVTGFALIGIALLVNRDIFDEEYLEEDQSVDPNQMKLAKVYGYIEKYRFPSALKALDEFIADQGSSFELEKLRYDLMKSRRPKGYEACVTSVLGMRPHGKRDIALISRVWGDNPEMQEKLDVESQIKLAMNLAVPEHCSAAEKIFLRLHDDQQSNNSLGILARKLSVCFESVSNKAKRDEYAALADSYVTGVVR